MLKAIKSWQAVLAAVVVLGGVGYGAYVLFFRADEEVLADDQQVIPVQLGDLINLVSTNGSLFYPNRETLAFGSQGTVAEVLVEEGETVEEGQPLATLDAATVAGLERAVAQARLDLRNAEGALAAAGAGYTALQLAQAEASVATATLALQSAEDTLADLADGPTTEEIAGAQADADSALTSLSNAQGDLSLANKEWDAKVSAAQDDLETTTDGYRDAFDKWLGINLRSDEVALDPGTLLGSWGADLGVLFDAQSRSDVGGPGTTPPQDDPATPWSELTVYLWASVFPGTVLPTCDDVAVPPQGACVQAEMDAAWDAYQEADDALDTTQTRAAKAIANAEAGVTRATEALGEATDALVDLSAAPDPLDVAVKKKQLAVAQASLAKAQSDLAALRDSAPLELALLQAEVDSARSLLELELERLENSTLRAPMAGLVSFVGVEAGASVNRNTPIVEVVDPTVVELDGVVDEIDVLFVQVGAEAEVTMDALPGQTLRATVTSVATVGQNQQGVVSYPLRVRLEVPRRVQLLEGLSATANIVIRREDNVALVPLQAIFGTFDEPLVQVVSEGGSIEQRPVVLGNNDEFWVAVREGLTEGERVVMLGAAASTQQLDFRQAFRQFGRGPRGGGGGGRGEGGGRGRGGGGGGGGRDN